MLLVSLWPGPVGGLGWGWSHCSGGGTVSMSPRAWLSYGLLTVTMLVALCCHCSLCVLLPHLPSHAESSTHLETKTQSIPFLPVGFLCSWPCFAEQLPKKTRQRLCFAYICMHRHTHTCVAGTFLIDFDHISIPVDGGAEICKHVKVSGAEQSAAGGGVHSPSWGCPAAQPHIRQWRCHKQSVQHALLPG